MYYIYTIIFEISEIKSFLKEIERADSLLLFKTLFRAEARRTTILQPVEQKPHSKKDRQDEKAESYVPDEGTR